MEKGEDLIARSPSFAEQVANRIVEAIVSGEFRQGEHLVEAKLAERYGVSRGPVREALQLLGAQGLVENRGTKGTFVRSVSAEDLERMVVLRSTLEGLAARIVAATGTEEQLARLENIAKSMQDARQSQQIERFRSLHAEFHQALCEFAGYPMVSSWWQSMRNLARVFQGGWGTDEGEPGELEDHREHVRVLRQRDPDLAERYLRARVLKDGYKRLGRDVPPALQDYTGS